MRFFSERKRRKLLSELKSRRHAEDDLLSPALRRDFDAVIEDLADAPAENINSAVKEAKSRFSALPLPEKRGTIYAWLDLILVVGAVAFGLRGLYFQPFRIPTSSMQPTLYGIHYMSRENASNPLLGKLPLPLNNLLFGTTRAAAKAEQNSVYMPGTEVSVSDVIFDKTAFKLGSQTVVLPGNAAQTADYASLYPGRKFAQGETVADGFVSLGDHLFVERFSLYLSPPKRGDVMVFTTEGLSVNGVNLESLSGYYYIKRLAALPGDTVKIVDNQLYVRPSGELLFSKIQDISDEFKKVYSMRGGYHGHLSDGIAGFAFGEEYTLPEDTFLMLGDNSKFSMDSRYFGPVKRKNLIGRAWIVFYPFSRRFGRVDKADPIDVPTGEAKTSTFPVMYRQ